MRVGRGSDDKVLSKHFGRSSNAKTARNAKIANGDRQTDRAGCRVACTRLKRWKVIHVHIAQLVTRKTLFLNDLDNLSKLKSFRKFQTDAEKTQIIQRVSTVNLSFLALKGGVSSKRQSRF